MAESKLGIGCIDIKEKFKKILFNYDRDMILSTYNAHSLLKVFSENFTIKNIESSRNLWRLYAKSIISACKFMSQFEDAEDFNNFVDRFNYKNLTVATLPMLLEKEIIGLGFPLACNFLKDLGFSEYPKPDVHIKDILVAFDLCENNDYSAYKAMVEMAKVVNDTAFNVDRLFWLIGSGKYYLHNITVGRNKEQYINRVKSLCNAEV